MEWSLKPSYKVEKLRLQVEIRFHIHVVIFPATFFFTKLSHEITRVRTVHDMLTTPSVYSLRNAHFLQSDKEQVDFLRKHPLKLAHPLHARLALLGVVVLPGSSLTAVDPQSRPIESIEQLPNSVEQIAYHLKQVTNTNDRKCLFFISKNNNGTSLSQGQCVYHWNN